jgi:hypothetical protein
MSAFRPAFRASFLCTPMAVLVLGIAPVHAATFTVGTTGGCSHVNLQTAVNTAQASPGPHTIRVNSETFTAQEVSITTSQELNIIGGHADCSAGQPTPNSRSILDGTGGNPRSVMRMVVATGGLVRLLNLTIRRGDLTASGTEGGGIYFEGNGRLGITETTIANNVAGYGAGLYLRGTGDAATVEFGVKVTVSGNTAWRSGGGVYAEQVKFSMLAPGCGIFLNEAQGTGDSGYGGGLVVLAKERDAYAYIGGGLGSTGSIFNNTARYGGGVAVVSDEGPGDTTSRAELQVISAAAGTPASIRNNKASVQGGGLYMRGYYDLIPPNAGSVRPLALLWNAELRGNSAPDGAAIYGDGEDAATFVTFNDDFSYTPLSFACPANQFCGGIIDNVAQTLDGTPTDGAVIHMIRGGGDFSTAFLTLGDHADDRPPRGGMTIEGNRGGRLIHVGDNHVVSLENVLISDNVVSRPLIDVEGGSGLYLTDFTLAGNVIASGNPLVQLGGGGSLLLRRSILWQPDRTSLNCSGCSKTFERVIASERTSLDGGNGTQVVVADPRFVDTGFGDYRLRAASPGVDYVPAIGGDDLDTLGLPRDVNLPIKLGAFGGVRDVGAFERQTLQPLVLNSDMNSDVRLWEPMNSATLSRDTLNASGGSGSGSLRVFRTGAAPGLPTRYARQCVHLPGPARYTLNGWGRSIPDALYVPPLDSTELHWELRHNGGENCTSGAIAASGTLALSNAGWNHPATPSVIDVFPAAWTIQSSLVVYLVVIDNSIPPAAATASAWFDGITLEAQSLDDVIFANGFD